MKSDKFLFIYDRMHLDVFVLFCFFWGGEGIHMHPLVLWQESCGVLAGALVEARELRAPSLVWQERCGLPCWCRTKN